MDLGSALQAAMLERALAYGLLIWLTVAIVVGLWASEMKKRRFWTWVLLSLATGPIAWYLLGFRLGVAMPPEQRVNCRKCGRPTRRDMRRCLHCRALLEEETVDRAAEVGRQAATILFTARRLMSSTRRAADAARNKPPSE